MGRADPAPRSASFHAANGRRAVTRGRAVGRLLEGAPEASGWLGATDEHRLSRSRYGRGRARDAAGDVACGHDTRIDRIEIRSCLAPRGLALYVPRNA